MSGKQTITTDANDDVLSVATEPVMATIGFARTVTFPNTFGAKEEASIFLQVPLEDTSSPEAIEAELAPNFALAKALIYKELGLDAEVTANGVVAAAPQVGDAPKSKGGGRKASGGSTPQSSGPLSDEEKNDLWAQLAGAEANGGNFKAQDGGETIWDNRTNKRNPKGPDFKWADSGKALWLKDAPEWFAGPGEGITI
jgi:hypothetical protein